MINNALEKLKSFLRQARILLTYPFARLQFRLRDRKRGLKVIPYRWLTQEQIISEDLEYYDSLSCGRKLDRDLADDMLKTRDSIYDKLKKSSTIANILMLFVYTQIFSVDLKISVMGVEIKNVYGAIELAVLISTALSTMALIQSSQIRIINSHLSYIIENKLEQELNQYYSIKYLNGNFSPIYTPYNLPHLSKPTSIYNSHIAISVVVLIFIILLVFAIVSANFYVSIYMFNHGTVNYFSKFTSITQGISTIISIYINLIIFSPLPHRDFTKLHYFEIGKQMKPELADQLRDEVWGDSARERIKDLEKLRKSGYIME